MATKKNSRKTPSVMDVSKPGKTPPSASSRPIIVGHKPLADDPMVKQSNKDEDTEEDTGHKITVSRTSPKIIKPLSEPTDEEKAPESSPVPAEPEPEKESETEAEAASSEATPEEVTSPTEPEAAVSEEAAVDAVAGQAPDKKAETKEAEAAQKQQEHLNQLIAEKKYFLPIRATKRKRRAQWIILTLLVLVAGTGAYLMLYTDFSPSDIKLPSFLGGKTEQPEETTPHEEANTDEDHTDTPATPVSAADDAQRRTDINALASGLQSYHTTHGNFPTLAELNDSIFRSDNLGGIDEATYQDPVGTESLLAGTPMTGTYAYTVMPAACDNETTSCATFTLSATLSDGSLYEKHSLN